MPTAVFWKCNAIIFSFILINIIVFPNSFQNSVSLWEGDGSLQGFPMEGYSGDGSRPPQMVSVPIPVYFEMLNYTQPVAFLNI